MISKVLIVAFIAGVVWYKLKINETTKETLIRLIAANESYMPKIQKDEAEYKEGFERLNEDAKRRLKNMKTYEGVMLAVAFAIIEVLIYV